MRVTINRYRKVNDDWYKTDSHLEDWSDIQFDNFIKNTKEWGKSARNEIGVFHEVKSDGTNVLKQVTFSAGDLLRTEWLFQ